jgi:hypothetical protein
MKEKYGQAVKNLDRNLISFIRGILKSSLSDNLKMIITSDHGEGLGEVYDSLYDGRKITSINHGHFPCPSQIRIPLTIYDSEYSRGSVSDKLVGLDNVSPTIGLWAGYKESNERSLYGAHSRNSLLAESISPFSMGRPEKGVAHILRDGTYVNTSITSLDEAILEDSGVLTPNIKSQLRDLGYLD